MKPQYGLESVKVIIAEGTYTSLLKHVDLKIFIILNRLTKLDERKKRSKGNEVKEPFKENILATEQKINAGHRQLADLINNDTFEVIIVEMENKHECKQPGIF